jgi:hypothetical protein
MVQLALPVLTARPVLPGPLALLVLMVLTAQRRCPPQRLDKC